MTAAIDIIRSAYREGNFEPIGHDPTAEQVAEGLDRLNALLGALFSVELGELQRDWPIVHEWSEEEDKRYPLTPGSDEETVVPWKYPPQNVRLLHHIKVPTTLRLPAHPTDGARISVLNMGSSAKLTLHASGRLIESKPLVVGTPGEMNRKTWFYRADLGDWVLLPERIEDESGELPLPAEYDDYFVTGLAMRLAPRYGIQLEAAVGERFTDMQSRIVGRYKDSARPMSTAELRNIMGVTP